MRPDTTSAVCVECGKPMPAAAWLGQCSACALRGALAVEAGSPGGPGDFGTGDPDPADGRALPLGEFVLLDEIGRGGMGVVYRARQRSLDRLVALKMLLPGTADAESLRRFRAEASAAAALQHPNIVSIHEVGAHDGRQYLVMDLVEGRSLARHIVGAAPRLDPRQAARWLASLADAVQYAHDRGILHRDIKPSNVLIDERGEPRITDFGLAMRLAADADVTLSRAAIGSPSFMPPEQAGGHGKVSRRSDVYGLGATLYQALTGRPPFTGDTTAEVLHRVLAQEPVPPRRLAPSLPRDLETICLKCLEKDPMRRYASAGEVALELRRFLQGEPIAARPVGATARAVRTLRKKPLAAVVVVSLAVAGWFGWQSVRSSRLLHERSVQQAINTAISAAWSGNVEAANRAIAEAERAGATPAWIRMLRGQAALYRMANARAVAELEAAVELAPDSVAAMAMLAQALLHAGRYDRHEEVMAQLAFATPRTPEDYLFLGAAAVISDSDTARPVALLQEAVRQRPTGASFVTLAMAEGFHALDAGSWAIAQKAMGHSETAIELLGTTHPVARCVHLHAANAGLRLCPGPECDAVRRRAADAARGDVCNIQRGFYYEFIGDLDAEIAAWRLAGSAGGVYANYFAAGMLARNRSAEALDLLPELGPSPDGFTAMAHAFLLLDAGRRREGEALRAGQLERHGSSRLLTGALLLLEGDVERAASESRTLLGHLPAEQLHLDVFRYWAGQLTEEGLLETIGESRVAACSAHFAAGLSAIARGDTRAATAHFRQSVAANAPIRIEYHWSRAFLARLTDDPNWAERLRAQHPSDIQPN